MKTNKLNPSGSFQGVHDIRVLDLPIPELTDDSVLIKIAMAGICGSDLHFYHEPLLPPGTVLGHEFTGTIQAVGKNIKDLDVGSRVVVNPMIAGTGLGHAPGGFARYILIEKAKAGYNVLTIPNQITDDKGALIEPLTVGLAAVKLSDIKPGQTALITGAGPIGLAVLASLNALGIHDVAVSDVSETRLKIADDMGAKFIFNPSEDGDMAKFLSDSFGKNIPGVMGTELPNLNFAFECSGVTPVFWQSVEVLGQNGELIVVAGYSKKVELDPNVVLQHALRIKGSFAYSSEDMQDAIDLVAEGKIDLTPIITHRFLLKDLPEAFATQADGKISVKVLVKPE
ncbi:zinc-binding dehydrogenase [Mucilaginibacter roseus]|uniref:Zinc-binding dehydrogenase n=1 Tax=Mucilaginibacter roseus TaxID=1528868 RepID=A0ABS8TVX0_9SPHI|nr:zinc-binding dehydrogenase [Mucilaginibacter roseus]MCD8739024.1 zinc-binding dehydrogenase [Mucilaginibacter roseus]